MAILREGNMPDACHVSAGAFGKVAVGDEDKDLTQIERQDFQLGPVFVSLIFFF